VTTVRRIAPASHASSRTAAHKHRAKPRHVAKRHHAASSAAPKHKSVVKPLIDALSIQSLAHPPTDSSSPVAARYIGVAGLSLLLLALAGCGLLMIAARFERGGLGG
jgi:hypothetical protein